MPPRKETKSRKPRTSDGTKRKTSTASVHKKTGILVADKRKRAKEIEPGFDEDGNVLSPQRQGEILAERQAHVDHLTMGVEWKAIICDNYLIPKQSVVNDKRFHWPTLQKQLTIYPKDSMFAKRKRMWRERTDGRQFFGENDKYYAVPVQFGIDHFGRPFEDQRFAGEPFAETLQWKGHPLWGVGEGNYDQQPCADVILQHLERTGRGGMIELPTGSGKTMVAEWLTVKPAMRRKTLIIVPNSGLIPHWRDEILENIPDAKVTVVQGAKIDKSGDFVIAMLNTIAGSAKIDVDWFQPFGVVIMDELHRAGAKQLSEAIPRISQVKKLLGLTATLKRPNDRMDKMFELFLGPLILRGTPVTRGCKYVDILPVRFYLGQQLEIRQESGDRNAIAMTNALGDDPARNELLLHLIGRCLADGRRTLMFVGKVEHAAALAEEARRRWPDKKIVHAKSGQSKAAKAERKQIFESSVDLILSTSELLGTGINLRHVDTMIEAEPFKNEIRALQDSGRFRPPIGGWQPDTRRRVFLYVVDPFDPFTDWWNDLRKIFLRKTYTILDAEHYRDRHWEDSGKNVISNCLPASSLPFEPAVLTATA